MQNDRQNNRQQWREFKTIQRFESCTDQSKMKIPLEVCLQASNKGGRFIFENVLSQENAIFSAQFHLLLRPDGRLNFSNVSAP